MSEERVLYIRDKLSTPTMNAMCKKLLAEGPTEEETTLLCVIAILDETMYDISRTNTSFGAACMQTYAEIEQYLKQEGFQ